jgi:hypothetical protein
VLVLISPLSVAPPSLQASKHQTACEHHHLASATSARPRLDSSRNGARTISATTHRQHCECASTSETCTRQRLHQRLVRSHPLPDFAYLRAHKLIRCIHTCRGLTRLPGRDRRHWRAYSDTGININWTVRRKVIGIGTLGWDVGSSACPTYTRNGLGHYQPSSSECFWYVHTRFHPIFTLRIIC